MEMRVNMVAGKYKVSFIVCFRLWPVDLTEMARTGDESDPTDILVGDETGPAAFVDEDAKNSEELEKRLRMCNLRKSTYLACVTSMVLYSADVLSDIFVGVKYLASKQWDYAAMTFGFFILATFLCNFTAPAPAW